MVSLAKDFLTRLVNPSYRKKIMAALNIINKTMITVNHELSKFFQEFLKALDEV